MTRLPLDREETNSYSLYVVAMDTSGIPLNATATVAVVVLDRNDNVPEFSAANFSIEVPEDAELDTLIMEFNVSAAEYVASLILSTSTLHNWASACEKVANLAFRRFILFATNHQGRLLGNLYCALLVLSALVPINAH